MLCIFCEWFRFLEVLIWKKDCTMMLPIYLQDTSVGNAGPGKIIFWRCWNSKQRLNEAMKLMEIFLMTWVSIASSPASVNIVKDYLIELLMRVKSGMYSTGLAWHRLIVSLWLISRQMLKTNKQTIPQRKLIKKF